MEATRPGSTPSQAPHPVTLEVTDDLTRNRLTVFFRLILAIPHLVWVSLWGFVAVFAAIANWFATLFSGRSPDGLHNFLAAYIRYWTHVQAYLYFVADPFPGFKGRRGTYPVDVDIEGPQPQNRWITGFRLILAIPALILATVLRYVYQVIGFLGWFVCLALGRMPQGMRDLSAYCLRFEAQTHAYTGILTDRYPSLSSGPTA
jgi:Domain of unknown function (DUF4389)